MKHRTLTALPVFNEAAHVQDVLEKVLLHSDEVLVVNDGSTDQTLDELRKFGDRIHIVNHESNQGYGAALRTAFDYAVKYAFDVLVTIDCDGQHQPTLINHLAARLEAPDAVDMVSGSRYLEEFSGNSTAPADRRRINRQITVCLNQKLGLGITDAFCGFKAYRVSSLPDLEITDLGYAMPLQLWIQASDLNWDIAEFPVPLVYLDEERSFGGSLDDAHRRLAHYRSVLNAELSRRGMKQRFTSECGQT